MPLKDLCTLQKNPQMLMLIKPFHALDICPASPHKSPSAPQRALPRLQLDLVSLVFITSQLFKLLTFSLGSDTPDCNV